MNDPERCARCGHIELRHPIDRNDPDFRTCAGEYPDDCDCPAYVPPKGGEP